MIKRLKRKIVYLLGGIMVSDLPVELRAKILKYYSAKTIDKYLFDLLLSGPFTKYND